MVGFCAYLMKISNFTHVSPRPSLVLVFKKKSKNIPKIDLPPTIRAGGILNCG